MSNAPLPAAAAALSKMRGGHTHSEAPLQAPKNNNLIFKKNTFLLLATSYKLLLLLLLLPSVSVWSGRGLYSESRAAPREHPLLDENYDRVGARLRPST